MPELPEVETIVSDLKNACLIGKKLNQAKVFFARSIAVPDVKSFEEKIKGQQIENLFRRGKYIGMAFTSGFHLLIHLRMSGKLYLEPDNKKPQKHVHVIFKLDDGRSLHFHDTRKFGRMFLLEDTGPVLGGLGPEPLSSDFTVLVLKTRILSHNRQLKPLLLDQSVIAGLGNIYVDESLWSAGLSPLRNSSTLKMPEIKRLHKAIRSVLKKAIANRGTTLGHGKTNFASIEKSRGKNQEMLNVVKRIGKPCLKCGTPIKRIVVGQRGTHICPICQKVES